MARLERFLIPSRDVALDQCTVSTHPNGCNTSRLEERMRPNEFMTSHPFAGKYDEAVRAYTAILGADASLVQAKYGHGVAEYLVVRDDAADKDLRARLAPDPGRWVPDRSVEQRVSGKDVPT
jgi:hypothetical protein